jgi:hypothetical protein
MEAVHRGRVQSNPVGRSRLRNATTAPATETASAAVDHTAPETPPRLPNLVALQS